ncbi:hypothetical protein GF362_04020 [Candidatus Dojkabacteria bacterium]|nr:hypothetical protein [Candidatus Dojkabacteria bacterium]
MANIKTTQDLKTIEEWAKVRGGIPCKVKGTDDLIRIRFDPLEENLEEITWAEFFEILEDQELQFLYDESEENRFYKLIEKDKNE